jgi:hypothetical protein
MTQVVITQARAETAIVQARRHLELARDDLMEASHVLATLGEDADSIRLAAALTRLESVAGLLRR